MKGSSTDDGSILIFKIFLVLAALAIGIYLLYIASMLAIIFGLAALVVGVILLFYGIMDNPQLAYILTVGGFILLIAGAVVYIFFTHDVHGILAMNYSDTFINGSGTFVKHYLK